MRKAQNCKIEHRVGLYDFEVTHSIFEINLFHRLSFGILESHGEPLPMSSMGKRKVFKNVHCFGVIFFPFSVSCTLDMLWFTLFIVHCLCHIIHFTFVFIIILNTGNYMVPNYFINTKLLCINLPIPPLYLPSHPPICPFSSPLLLLCHPPSPPITSVLLSCSYW